MPVDVEAIRDLLDEHEDAKETLEELVNVVDDSGGVIQDSEGNTRLAACPAWAELADVYMRACEVLGIEPQEGQPQEGPAG